ncbi:DNA-directed RNA polymerase II 19 kD polypeptide rpb7 [Entamoeba marina]
MFFEITLKYQIQITPDHLNEGLERHVVECIKKETGYNKDYECIVVYVKQVKKIKPIRIAEGSGNIIFEIEYDAIVQKVINKEVVPGTVVNVNEDGISVDVGAFKAIHITSKKIPDCEYNAHDNVYRDTDPNTKFEIRVGDKIRTRLDIVQYSSFKMTSMASIERSFSSTD